jgi:abortive infection bacteriophage resistance protein
MRHLRNLCVHHGKLIGESLRIAPPKWNDSVQPHHIKNALFWVEHLNNQLTERDSVSNALGVIRKDLESQCPQSLWI